MSFKQNNADNLGRLQVLSTLLLVILCCSLKVPVLVVASSMTRTFTSDFNSLNHVPWVGYNIPSKRNSDTQSVHQGQMLHETTIYMDEDEDESDDEDDDEEEEDFDEDDTMIEDSAELYPYYSTVGKLDEVQPPNVRLHDMTRAIHLTSSFNIFE